MQVFLGLFSKVGANIEYIEVNTSNFSGFIMEFTKTENILIIYRNKTLSIIFLIQGSEIISLNISNLGKYFEGEKKKVMEK